MDGPYNSLEHLNRELSASSPAGSFAPVLSMPPAARGLSRHCEWCCHWSLPLTPPYRGRETPHSVPLLFQEWLVYRIHVQMHQHLDLVLVS